MRDLPPDKMSKLFKAFERIVGENDNAKVLSSFTMSPDQLKKWKEIEKTRRDALTLRNKAETLVKKFWAEIEIDRQDFNSSMQVNSTTLEIEVLDPSDEE